MTYPKQQAEAQMIFRKTGGFVQGNMTLRDHFAAQALTGAQIWDAVLNGKNSVFVNDGVDKLAEIAYAVADAMLKAREA
jgi:hypothetical protein